MFDWILKGVLHVDVLAIRTGSYDCYMNLQTNLICIEESYYSKLSSNSSNPHSFGDSSRIASNAEKEFAAVKWHSDVTWREEPSMGSILRGVVIPETG